MSENPYDPNEENTLGRTDQLRDPYQRRFILHTDNERDTCISVPSLTPTQTQKNPFNLYVGVTNRSDAYSTTTTQGKFRMQ